MSLITIDEGELNKLLQQAEKFVFDGDGEEAIVDIEQALETVLEVDKRLKEALKRNATLVDDKSQKFEGDRVSVTLSKSGPRYQLVDEEKCPHELMELKLNAKATEQFVKENQQLPPGVNEKQDRPVSVRIRVL